MTKRDINTAFGIRDVIYIIGGVLALTTHYWALKMELQMVVNKQQNYENITNIRLNFLEENKAKQTSFYQNKDAILPNEIKLKKDN